MTVAHVSRRATASQVATVVGAAISIVRDTAVTTADFSTAEEHATATNARIITVDNLCGQPAAAAEQVQAIESDASRVYTSATTPSPSRRSRRPLPRPRMLLRSPSAPRSTRAARSCGC